VPPASLADTEAAEWQQSETENFNLTPEQKEAGEKAAGVQVSLPTNLSAAKGSTILIPLMLSNKTDREISGYAVEITFDSRVLQIDADNPIETSGTLSEDGGFSVAAQTETPGRIGIAAGGGKSAVNSAGTLVNLRFTVIGEANNSKKSSPLSVSRKSFEDQEGMRIAARSGNHQFTVKTETPTVAGVGVGGKVFGKDGQGIGNVLVRLVDR
jgi:hypothetical protein